MFPSDAVADHPDGVLGQSVSTRDGELSGVAGLPCHPDRSHLIRGELRSRLPRGADCSPCVSSPDGGDSLSSDSYHTGDSPIVVASREAHAHHGHLRGGKFRARRTALIAHVVAVGPAIAKKEVVRADARWVVASMKYARPAGDGAEMDVPGYAVSARLASQQPRRAVSLTVSEATPLITRPASRGVSHQYLSGPTLTSRHNASIAPVEVKV